MSCVDTEEKGKRVDTVLNGLLAAELLTLKHLSKIEQLCPVCAVFALLSTAFRAIHDSKINVDNEDLLHVMFKALEAAMPHVEVKQITVDELKDELDSPLEGEDRRGKMH